MAAYRPTILVILHPHLAKFIGQPLTLISMAGHAIVIIGDFPSLNLGRMFGQYGNF
jgi:hypothetical protein